MLEAKMAGMTPAMFTFNGKCVLTTFNEDNKEGHCEYEYCNQQQQKEVQVALPRLLDGMANGRRKTRNNTCEDNDRNTVTDTTLSNLFAQPHQEHCS